MQEIVFQEADNMALVFDIEKDVRYRQGKDKGLEEGIEKGIEKGREEGLLEGIELALMIKFGNESLDIMDKIKAISDINKLEQVKGFILKSKTIAELEGMLTG
ncbi:hypothetical protein MCHI_003699 [Candidatus Magnetoovum chiemensis]|nr:hypothetical protein MCHI_003699 [Candidatus Magnetoovum chiemensis]